MRRPTQPLPFAEFVVLLALMISIVAMATDIMLPALSVIGEDLRIAHANDVQLVVSSLFAGFALGQLIAGPLSDSFGRKPVIYWGYVVFTAGCLLSVVAADLTTMLIGRVLQGLGAAAPRVVLVSMVRDGYAGRAMARIMSIVMSVWFAARQPETLAADNRRRLYALRRFHLRRLPLLPEFGAAGLSGDLRDG